MFILAADKRKIKMVMHGRVSGTVDELKAAGIQIDESNSYSVAELLQGKHLESNRKPTKEERRLARKARKEKSRKATDGLRTG